MCRLGADIFCLVLLTWYCAVAGETGVLYAVAKISMILSAINKICLYNYSVTHTRYVEFV